MSIRSRDLSSIYERLRVLQIGSSNFLLPAILDSKRLLDHVDKHILINDFTLPDYIDVENKDTLCFDWFKNINEKQVDIFSIYFTGNGKFTFESFMDSLGTHSCESYSIEEDLHELFIIHLNHFS